MVGKVSASSLIRWCRPFLRPRPMTTMNVSIPDAMKLWVEQQASSGRYANASDYVRHLIRLDQERMAKLAHMQSLVSAGIESGVGSRSMDELKAVASRRSRTPVKRSK